MQGSRTPDEKTETLALWYELGRLYSEGTGAGRRATRLGIAAACVAASLVLLSAPVFGTAWAGPFAPLVPLAAGLVFGAILFIRRRSRWRGRVADLRQALAAHGLDAGRPAQGGLAAYYDAQLVLLRSEYEYLRLRSPAGGGAGVRLFEESFGFTPEDPFETGPLNVAPDTEAMEALRGRWEKRLASRRERGIEAPMLGLREDAAYGVFPREMTVPVELATRGAYLEISRGLLRKRWGSDPLAKADLMTAALRRRIERDLAEYAAVTGRAGLRGWRARSGPS